jgi:hypothetical protein
MQHHTDTTGDLLSVMLGWATAFFGQIALFGLDMIKAGILGAVGALAGLIVRHFWKKYFNKKAQ